MGDPTLRLHHVMPPAHVQSAPNPAEADGVLLSWAAVPEAEAYWVYKMQNGSWGEPVAVLQSAPSAADPYLYQDGRYTDQYMVRALALVQSGSGSYYELSQGAYARPAGALLVGRDDTTQGNWQGVYGSQGQVIYQDRNTLPSSFEYQLSGAGEWVWDYPANDVRALQTGPGTRIAATAYAWESFDVDLDVKSGFRYVSMYFLDYDAWSRSERVEVFDATTGTLLSSYDLLGNFTGGSYLTWEVSGHVRFHISNLPDSVNAVLSGIFID
jgi:hypothetical protein